MGRATLSHIFGTVLREHREAAGLSQEALADLAGVHRTYVGLVERGRRNPTLEIAYRFAAGVGTSLAALVREVEDRFRRS